MAITSVTLLYSGISSSSTPTKQSYTATYQVILNAPTSNPAFIENDPRLPFYGAFFPGNPFAICVSKAASSMDETRLKWTVTVTFETQDKDDDDKKDDDGKESDNPFDWRDKVEWLSAKYTVALDEAILLTDGIEFQGVNTLGPVRNSVGDPFDPPAEKEKNRRILRITKTLRDFPVNQADEYDNTINNDIFTILKPGLKLVVLPWRAKLDPITGTLEYYQSKSGFEIPYWRVTYELSILREDWNFRLLNKGFNRKVDAGDKDDNGHTLSMSEFSNEAYGLRARKAAVKDMNALEVRVPVLLDLDGQPLAPGDEPVFISYQGYQDRAFRNLRL